MKAAFYTLGCKVNQYDTDAMAELLRQAGYDIVGFDDVADVYVINSCTVTGTGDKKSRQMVHRAREKNENAIVCMAGCYPQVAQEEVAKLDVDLIIGTGNRSKLPELIVQAQKGTVVEVEQRDIYEEIGSGPQNERTRAYLKIQDGCDSYCSYCIIPYARGASRSRQMAPILQEARALEARGYRELVLTGIHLSFFGKDTGASLLDLLRQLDAIDGLWRIRLGSLDSPLLTKDFVEGLAGINKLCDGFHISLQSGSDTVLRRMNRAYTTAEYEQAVRRLRQAFPGCGVMTDIIVGFPGETEQEWEECLHFVEHIGFSRVHIFPYSRRKGTPAADMDGQVPRQQKEQRAHQMAKVAGRLAETFHRKWVGKSMEVLLEQELENGWFSGYTQNYIRVFVQGEELENKLVRCKITDLKGDGLWGELEEIYE